MFNDAKYEKYQGKIDDVLCIWERMYVKDRQRKKKQNLITCDQPLDRQFNLQHDVSSMTEIR